MGGNKFDPNFCKTQLKLAVNRLKLQKNKKENAIKNQKREIAELIRSGKDESARIKVEGVIREDFIIEAYEILELFCELVLARLNVLQITKDCPGDMREAICTLIYAAPRAEVKELLEIRQQLISKFGKEFGMDAMRNKDNCVNARVIHKLAIQTPENYLVFQYLNEIAKSHNLEWRAELSEPSILPPSMHTAPAMTSDPLLSFPTVTPSGPTPGISSFPSPPSFPSPMNNNNNMTPPANNTNNNVYNNYHNFTNAPQFPAPPNFQDIPIPTFTPHEVPGFPAVPAFPASTPSVPPTSPVVKPISPLPPPSSTPSVNSLPPASNFLDLNFPSIPSNFPNPPASTSNTSVNTSASNLNFPSPPGVRPPPPSDFVFPDVPSSNRAAQPSDDSAPDFDELTARFEKLKKRDL